MAYVNIDAATPLGSNKGKVLDEQIRDLKTAVKANLAENSNYATGDTQGTLPALRTAVWATAGRPTGTDLVDRVSGYNTDLLCDEYYDLATTTWIQRGKTVITEWTTATRPATPYTGQMGYNTTLAVAEMYTGSAWQRMGAPAGEIKTFGMATAPTGYLACDGTAVSRTTYADLFAAIGTTWGVGDGSTTFALPDLEDQFLKGAGTNPIATETAQSVENLVADVAYFGATGAVAVGYKFVTCDAWTATQHYNTNVEEYMQTSSQSLAKGVVVQSLGTGTTQPANVAVLYCIKI